MRWRLLLFLGARQSFELCQHLGGNLTNRGIFVFEGVPQVHSRRRIRAECKDAERVVP
jgi:hypothetical protein